MLIKGLEGSGGPGAGAFVSQGQGRMILVVVVFLSDFLCEEAGEIQAEFEVLSEIEACENEGGLGK